MDSIKTRKRAAKKTEGEKNSYQVHQVLADLARLSKAMQAMRDETLAGAKATRCVAYAALILSVAALAVVVILGRKGV